MNHVKFVESGTILTPKGFQAAGVHSGVKRKRKDLGVIFCEKPANVAAVYTLNKIQAAPLTVTKESIAENKKIQAVVVNSGNANACTGKQGLERCIFDEKNDSRKIRNRRTIRRSRIDWNYWTGDADG